jgi:copper transport protein
MIGSDGGMVLKARTIRKTWQLNWILSFLTICVISVWIGLHSVVYAHAYIVKSVPQVNQSLGSPPHTVQIWFDEPVQSTFNALTVTDENGKRIDLNDAHIDRNNPDLLECNLDSGLQNGLYSVNWRVISADGHPVSGVIPFHIGLDKGNAQAQQAVSQGYVPGPGMILIRWLLFFGMLSYLGLLVFRYFVLPKKSAFASQMKFRFSCLLWASSSCIAVSIILGLPLQTKIDAGVNFVQAIQPELLRKILVTTQFGNLWMIQFAVLLALLIATFLAKGQKHLVYLFSGFLVIGLLITKSMTGHAASGPNPGISITLDVIHLVAASIWLGSLLGIVLLLPRFSGAEEATERRKLYFTTIRRFSLWGICSVLVLAVSGTYAALMQIPTRFALLHTAYGQTLIVKLSIFLLMFGLAVYHWLSGHLGKKSSGKNLNKTIWIEFGLGMVVLIVTAMLTNLQTAMSTPGPVLQKNALADGGTASLEITPNLAGKNMFMIKLQNEQGKPDTDVQQVTLAFTSSKMNMGSDTIRLNSVKPGQYEISGLYLTMAGRWKIHLDILTDSFQDVGTDFKIVTGSPENE